MFNASTELLSILIASTLYSFELASYSNYTSPSYSTQRASRTTDRWEWPGDKAIIMYCVKGCGLQSVCYVEVKIILRCLFGPERLSVIENWEVVRSSEVHNVLKLC